jgi:hypothetical protein
MTKAHRTRTNRTMIPGGLVRHCKIFSPMLLSGIKQMRLETFDRRQNNNDNSAAMSLYVYR